MGHSMGGGCSFLAAESNPNITTVVGFAPAETNPSAIAAAANAAIPALVFIGSKDAVTAPAGNATAIYNAVPADCKAYVTITDGSHCRFAESSALCEFGESSSCLGCSFISRPQHHSLTFQYLNPWLRFYLKGECDQFDVFQNLLTSVSEVTTEQSCNYSLPVADFSISGMTEFCDRDSVLFSASGSYDFQWSNGDTTSFITIFESGNYQLIVTDYMNCRDTSRSETIVANPPPAPLIEQRGDSLLVTGNFIIQWLLEGDSITGATELSIIPTSVGWYSAMVTDSNGCSGMTDSVQILLTIIKENMPTKQIALYPNPTNGKVYFDDYLKQTKIFNIYGEAVMELNGSEADLSELAQGVYLLKEGERVVRIFKY